MSEEEKKRLNQLGQSILKKNGFDLEKHQDHDWIKNELMNLISTKIVAMIA